MPNFPTDPDHLRNVTQELINTITSPEVIEKMRQFRENAAAGGDYSGASEFMSLAALKAAGANLPEGFRITSRTFEDKQLGKTIDLGPELRLDANSPLPVTNALSGCAGGGAATVCACAGGGS